MSKNSKQNKILQNKNETIKLNSRAAAQAYYESKRCLKAKDLGGAFLNCAKAIELDPNLVELYCLNIDILIAQHSKLAALQAQAIVLSKSLQISDKVYDEMQPSTSTYSQGYRLEEIREEQKALGRDILVALNEIKRLDLLSANQYFYTGSYLQEILGKDQKAIEQFNKVIELNRKYPNVYYKLGCSLERLGQGKEAADAYSELGYYEEERVPGLVLIEVINKAIKLNPDCTKAYITRGCYLYKIGAYTSAEKDFRTAIHQDPNNFDAYHGASCALQELGKYQEALIACEEALKRDNKSVMVLSNKGTVLFNLGQFQEALTTYKIALDLAPKHATLPLSIALTLQALGQPNEAMFTLKTALNLAPRNTDFHIAIGELLLELRQPKEALNAFKEALNLQSKHIEAQCGIGRTLLILNKSKKALEAFEEALQWNSRHADAHVGKGQALFKLAEVKKLNNLEEVLEAFNEALKWNHRHADAYVGKGQVLLKLAEVKKLNNLEEVLEAFNEALKWNHRHADAYVGKGQVLLKLAEVKKLNNLEEVLEAFNEALKWNHRHADAYVGKGQALLSRNSKLALEAFDKALKYNPALAEAHVGKAQASLALARLEEAYTASKQALDYKPDYPEAHYYKGRALLKLVEFPEELLKLPEYAAEYAEVLNKPRTAIELLTEAYKDFKKLKDNASYPESRNHCILICCDLAEYEANDNNHSQEITWLKNLLVLDPANLARRAQLGKAWLKLAQRASEDNEPNDRLDHLKEALKEFKILASHPECPYTAHYNIGTINLELAQHAAKSNQLEQALQRTEQACASFVTALTLFGAQLNCSGEEVPFSTITLASYSQLGVVLPQLATAIGKHTNLNKIRKIWEKAGDAYENALKFFGEQLQYHEVATKLEAIYLETLAHRDKALLTLSNEAEELNKPEEESNIPEAPHNLANDFNRLLRIGEGVVKVANPKEPLDALGKTLEVYPDNVEIYYNKSLAYKQLADEAKKSKNFVEALSWLQEAQKDVDQSLTIKPYDQHMITQQGEIEMELFKLIVQEGAKESTKTDNNKMDEGDYDRAMETSLGYNVWSYVEVIFNGKEDKALYQKTVNGTTSYYYGTPYPKPKVINLDPDDDTDDDSAYISNEDPEEKTGSYHSRALFEKNNNSNCIFDSDLSQANHLSNALSGEHNLESLNN